MVTRPASSLAQDRESLPAETSVLTTMLHRHLSLDLAGSENSGSDASLIVESSGSSSGSSNSGSGNGSGSRKFQ